MAGFLAGSAGVLYLDDDVHVDVIDGGVHLTGLHPDPATTTVVSTEPKVLWRLAACLMIAADQLGIRNSRRDVTGVPH